MRILMLCASLALSAASASIATDVGTATGSGSHRFSPRGYASVYEATSLGCQREADLVCSVAIRRMNETRDNGLFIAAQKDSFVSTISDGNHHHYPATRAVIEGTKTGDRSGVSKAFAPGEEVTFDLTFAAPPSIGSTINELTVSMNPIAVVNFSQVSVR